MVNITSGSHLLSPWPAARTFGKIPYGNPKPCVRPRAAPIWGMRAN